MKSDDYSTGRHFWTHFLCGLVIGGGVGTWTCCDMFDSGLCNLALVGGIALVVALGAGMWGDSFWYLFLSGL